MIRAPRDTRAPRDWFPAPSPPIATTTGLNEVPSPDSAVPGGSRSSRLSRVVRVTSFTSPWMLNSEKLGQIRLQFYFAHRSASPLAHQSAIDRGLVVSCPLLSHLIVCVCASGNPPFTSGNHGFSEAAEAVRALCTRPCARSDAAGAVRRAPTCKLACTAATAMALLTVCSGRCLCVPACDAPSGSPLRC